jgi:sec-independent protein translocase protein TatB
MSNFGAGEMLVVFLLALIVLGPERLPKVARQAGAVMRQLRQMSSGFQEELRSAIEDPQPPKKDVAGTKDFSGKLTAVPDEPVEPAPVVADEVRAGDASEPAAAQDASSDTTAADGEEPPASGARAAG